MGLGVLTAVVDDLFCSDLTNNVGKVGGPCALPAPAGDEDGRKGEPTLAEALKEPDQDDRSKELGAECRVEHGGSRG